MSQRSVEIETPDGICPAALSVPAGKGPWPGVILFPDAGGMRDTMRQMGDRLSGFGYVVLIPDFYYRLGAYAPIDMRTVMSDKDSMQRLMDMMQGYTPDNAATDAGALVDYLESIPETRMGGVGTTGYCMGGRLSLMAAANLGDRILASASFHGGGLAKAEDPNSPHHRAAEIRASVFVAGAIDDQLFTTEDNRLLELSLTKAAVVHTIETYPGYHGFAVPDNPRFDEAASDRHWQAIEQFFGSSLR